MTTTMQTIRRTAALGVFAAVVLAGAFAPRFASAHVMVESDPLPIYVPNIPLPIPPPAHPAQAPPNLRVESVPGLSHTTAVISWDRAHSHDHFRARGGIRLGHPSRNKGYWVTLSTTHLPTSAGTIDRCIDRSVTAPPGCIRRQHAAGPYDRNGRIVESVVVHDLTPETTYYVHVAGTFHASGKDYASTGTTTTFTTTANPDGTPTEPEPPGPASQTCTYKHRLIGVPGTTGGGYTSQILISSEDSKATVKLRAYQSDNGAPIDVLDSTGSAVGATTSLSPANSLKVFRLEGAQGWHTVIVSHPTARAMRRATVAMRLREPDVGVNIIPAQGIEDCTPAVTTVE